MQAGDWKEWRILYIHTLRVMFHYYMLIVMELDYSVAAPLHYIFSKNSFFPSALQSLSWM